MMQELIYTSAPEGLRAGSRGFCTVASTQGMAKNLAERLEELSAYKHLYSSEEAQAAGNPVAYGHVVLSVGGKRLHVLSRVADAGLDYSHRSNKLAHHLALETTELPPAGPAWLLAQPGVMVTAWEGEPRILQARRRLPSSSSPAAVCSAWQAATGDAGWGGFLAQHAQPGRGKHVVLVYPLGTNVLALFQESLALLPPPERWQTTFNTYFTRLPTGVECAWRGFVAGTPEAKAAQRAPNAIVIDLGAPLGAPPESALVQAARTGQVSYPQGVMKGTPVPTQAAMPRQAVDLTRNLVPLPALGEDWDLPPIGQPNAAGTTTSGTELALGAQAASVGYELAKDGPPSLAAAMNKRKSSTDEATTSASSMQRRGKWIWIATGATAVVLLNSLSFGMGWLLGSGRFGRETTVAISESNTGGQQPARPNSQRKEASPPKPPHGGKIQFGNPAPAGPDVKDPAHGVPVTQPSVPGANGSANANSQLPLTSAGNTSSPGNAETPSPSRAPPSEHASSPPASQPQGIGAAPQVTKPDTSHADQPMAAVGKQLTHGTPSPAGTAVESTAATSKPAAPQSLPRSVGLPDRKDKEPIELLSFQCHHGAHPHVTLLSDCVQGGPSLTLDSSAPGQWNVTVSHSSEKKLGKTIAQFSYKNGKLVFQWIGTASEQDEDISRLRRSALRLTVDGQEYTIQLYKPHEANCVLNQEAEFPFPESIFGHATTVEAIVTAPNGKSVIKSDTSESVVLEFPSSQKIVSQPVALALGKRKDIVARFLDEGKPIVTWKASAKRLDNQKSSVIVELDVPDEEKMRIEQARNKPIQSEKDWKGVRGGPPHYAFAKQFQEELKKVAEEFLRGWSSKDDFLQRKSRLQDDVNKKQDTLSQKQSDFTKKIMNAGPKAEGYKTSLEDDFKALRQPLDMVKELYERVEANEQYIFDQATFTVTLRCKYSNGHVCDVAIFNVVMREPPAKQPSK